MDSVLALFSVHSIAAAALYDLPAIAEYTWHGACLACAELARRNQITDSHMPDLVEWLSKVRVSSMASSLANLLGPSSGVIL